MCLYWQENNFEEKKSSAGNITAVEILYNLGNILKLNKLLFLYFYFIKYLFCAFFFLFLVKSDAFESHRLCHSNSERLAKAADFCQPLSLNTSHIMFAGSASYLVPKGRSPTLEKGGKNRKGSSHLVQKYQSKKKNFLLLGKESTLRSSAALLQTVRGGQCLSGNKAGGCQHQQQHECEVVCVFMQRCPLHPCLYSASRVGLSQVRMSVWYWYHPVCNMLLAVCVVLYITVSNMDKLAQKLC